MGSVRTQQAPPPKVGEGTDEDFDSLTLREPLPAAPPEMGDQQEDDAFTLQMLQVEWRTNDPIYLFIMKPKNVPKPPVVLYLYSYPSETDSFLNLDFGRFLTRNGYAAVGFVSAMTGQRYHDRPMKEWFVSNLPEALVATTHDVQMILNYLEQRGDLDMQRVGMFGDGSGATIAILAAAADPRIKAVDLLNPWGNWPEWMAKSTIIPEKERADYLKPEYQKMVGMWDPVQWLPKLTNTRVRLQMVEKGITVTPDVCRERIAAAAPANATVVRYQNVAEFAKVAKSGTGFDWIKSELPPASDSQYQVIGATQKSGTPDRSSTH
jgi:dienelactone hydrolase